MTQPAILQHVAEYVANSLWQAPLLAGMTWLAIWIGKSEPAAQHRLWVATLALAVVLPLVGPGMVATIRGIRAIEGASHSNAADVQTNWSGKIVSLPAMPEIEGGFGHGTATSNPTVQNLQVTQTQKAAWLPMLNVRLSQTATGWLLGIYGAILLLYLVRLALSHRAARRLLHRARQRRLLAEEETLLRRCREALHTGNPRVLFSRDIHAPVTIGGRRPAILLPEEFSTAAEAEKIAIFCHELAHVCRGDYRTNWMCRLGSLPIAYHPATHGIQRQILRARELACDALAVEAMNSSIDYAKCLLSLARKMDTNQRMQAARGVGLFDHDALEERIMRLLETKNNAGSRKRALRTAGAGAAFAAAILTAAAFHITPTVRAAEIVAPFAPIQSGKPAAQPLPVQAIKTVARATDPAVTVDLRVPLRVNLPAKFLVPKVAVVPVRLETAALVSRPMPVFLTVQNAVPEAQAVPVPPLPPQPKATASPAPPAKPAPSAIPPIPPIPAMPALSDASALPALPPLPAIKPPAPVLHNDAVNCHLTLEQRARMERDLARANAQIQQETKRLNSPEFKAQMARMQQQIQQATKEMRSDAVQQQMKYLQSPKFKAQMEKMQRQIQAATKEFENKDSQRKLKLHDCASCDLHAAPQKNGPPR